MVIFWSLALAVTAIASAALYYAGAARGVNAGQSDLDSPERRHLKAQLAEIEADRAIGRLGDEEAIAARAELAREALKLKSESGSKGGVEAGARRAVTLLSIAATAILAGLTYSVLGSPDMPARPLAERTEEIAAEKATEGLSLTDAVAKIEAQLAQTPDDIRGWTVIAPAYMQLGRYADAEKALRKVIAAEGPTADRETDLGEALMMEKGGDATGEPMDLFRSAAVRDPAHVRSRYYMAGELTRIGRFVEAEAAWASLLALSKGGEAWVANAEAGLAFARNKGVMPTDPATGTPGGSLPDQSAIEGMVEGLSSRLDTSGGTIEEWTRLVRSRLVLDQKDLAQKAYDAARAAFPDASVRTELDVLAADNGLVATK
jgi:cytochrome c-type biogenesis protein CcmH